MNDTFYIQWHITNACNLRCRHCYQEDFSKDKDLDWRRLQKVGDSIFTALKAWGRKASIHLTGGEPLLKPEIFPLLAHLDRHPMVEELGIITNGLLLDREMVRKLVPFRKLQKIKISLDGGDEDTNDSIRPLGTFLRVMENLPLVRKEGKNFEVFLMFTAMKRNYQSLPSLIRLSQECGVQGLIIERFIPWGRGRTIREEVLEKYQWKEMVEGLLKFFSVESQEEGIASFQAFQVDFRAEEPELMGAPCVLGEDGLCVMPDGIIYPCRRFPLPLGSLLEDSLLAVWERSEILRKIRDKKNLKGKCGRCHQEECTGCRSLAYSLTGDFFGEDPHCWLIDKGKMVEESPSAK
jgi:radical SAM protein with 4Fe4S-binding SPASM domain